MIDESDKYVTRYYLRGDVGGYRAALRHVDGDPFHIGQCYEETPALQLACAKCGGVSFHLARGEYFTAVRCATCRWEGCVHEG